MITLLVLWYLHRQDPEFVKEFARGVKRTRGGF